MSWDSCRQYYIYVFRLTSNGESCLILYQNWSSNLSNNNDPLSREEFKRVINFALKFTPFLVSESSKPITKASRTSSMNRSRAKSPATQTKPITAPPKTSAPKTRRSSAGKVDARQHTPVESPTKSVMNSSMQAKGSV